AAFGGGVLRGLGWEVSDLRFDRLPPGVASLVICHSGWNSTRSVEFGLIGRRLTTCYGLARCFDWGPRLWTNEASIAPSRAGGNAADGPPSKCHRPYKP